MFRISWSVQMKYPHSRFLMLFSVAAMSFGFLSGCASSSASLGKGARAADGLVDSANLIREGMSRIDSTLGSMRALRTMTGGELPGLYSKYTKDLDSLESVAGRVASTNKKMMSEGKRYFDKWEEQIASMNNEEIRNRSTKRQAEVRKALDDVAKGYTKVSDEYSGLISDLRDIRISLKTDLTTDGVRSLSGPMERAEKSGQRVIDAAEKVAASYEALGMKMSAGGG
jgi:hypothetical protein